MSEQASARARELARRTYLERCAFPLIGEGESAAFAQGTASLFESGGRNYLVTAAHVAEDIAKAPDRYGIPLTEGEDAGTIWTLGKGLVGSLPVMQDDVAVFRFDETEVVARLKDGGRVFLSDAHVERAAASDFLILGWPAVDAQFRDGRVDACPTILQLGRISEEGASDLRLEWPPVGRDRDLHGISGAPIWSISTAEADAVWHPSRELKLFGVQHAVLPGEYVRGTAWAKVSALIESMGV